MHRTQHYANQILRPNNTSIFNIQLNNTQANGINNSLQSDSIDYFYSGAVSIGDAIQAINNKFYTWATVKLYYSIFYLSRSMLGANGFAILYDGSKPYCWKCSVGETPIKKSGQTHKVVLDLFVDKLRSSRLRSDIDSIPAFEWMMARREDANYKTSKFCEPLVPEHFQKIAATGVRLSIVSYATDPNLLLAFDKDHAILALPIAAMKQAIVELKNHNINIPEETKIYLASIHRDKNGPFAEIQNFLR